MGATRPTAGPVRRPGGAVRRRGCGMQAQAAESGDVSPPVEAEAVERIVDTVPSTPVEGAGGPPGARKGCRRSGSWGDLGVDIAKHPDRPEWHGTARTSSRRRRDPSARPVRTLQRSRGCQTAGARGSSTTGERERREPVRACAR